MEPSRIPILVVEDDPDVLTMVGVALQRAGYDPTLVSTVPAALDALATRPYAAMLTDYGDTSQMGRRVITHVQQLLPTPVIVVMTGHSREILADQLVNLPMTAFLPKPFSLSTLYAILAQCHPAMGDVRAAQHAGEP